MLNDLPNSESGTVTFQIKRNDVPAAKRLLSSIGFRQKTESLLMSGAPEFGSPEYSRQAIFGGLMVLSAFLNFGSLAIAQVINANSNTSSTVSLTSAAIFIAVMCGPIALMQLVGGVLNFVLFMRPLNGVLVIVSMIPMSPAWLISFPAALWYSNWMRGEVEGRAAKPNWGATTLMFIRESRWSKVLAVANVVGLAAIAALSAVYFGGYYPSSTTYRVSSITSESAAGDQSELVSLLRARLVDDAPAAEVRFDDAVSRIVVRDWQYNAEEIRNSLAIEGSVQLAWLDAADSGESVRSWLPVAGELEVDGLATGTEGLAKTLGTSGSLLDLKSESIGSVRMRDNELVIELSSTGRALLGETRPKSPAVALGLVVGGMVEGLAKGDAISSKRIRFQLSKQSELSSRSIEAALRGPALPFELELIDR